MTLTDSLALCFIQGYRFLTIDHGHHEAAFGKEKQPSAS